MDNEYATAGGVGRTEHHHNKLDSEEQDAESGRAPRTPSRTQNIGTSSKPRERGRVRFSSNSEVNDANKRTFFPLREPILRIPNNAKISPAHSSHNSITRQSTNNNTVIESSEPRVSAPRSRPIHSVLRNNSGTLFTGALENVDEGHVEKPTEEVFSALVAQKQWQGITTLVGSHPAPGSRRTSSDQNEEDEEGSSPHSIGEFPVGIGDIPLINMGLRIYDGPESESDGDHQEKQLRRSKTSGSSEAHKIVRAHTRKDFSNRLRIPNSQSSALISGQATPAEEQDPEDYVAQPEHFRGGVLSSLLKLYNAHGLNGHQNRDSSGEWVTSLSPSETPTPRASGSNTPSRKPPKWYKHDHPRDTLAGQVETSAMLSTPISGTAGREAGHHPAQILYAGGKSSRSLRLMDSAAGKRARPRLEDEIRITVHIAETLSRQKYLLKLCKALMSYGAPTHRLEEYLKMTARVLEIEGQFLYIPGCMLISFDDSSTHTTEVKVVRTTQGVDLGKLKDVHETYKEVVHDVIGVEEATQRLDAIIRKDAKYNRWVLVGMYGLASATVGPFAFEARLIDLPIAFALGSLLGILQLVIAPKSDLYSNVFEISAAVFTSFLARAFGSIPYQGGTLFCFSALAQSSIALILPGYLVLCGSLELQSKSIVAGSVRMVYAIIYSLFLGFGITVGTAIYGLIDSNATSSTTCSDSMNQYYRFFFVPAFTLCLCIINQAKWKQMPVMLLISFAGYVVNFFSSKKFPSNAPISNTLGALAVGVMGNLYSRMRHGVAAAALLPAIFVQVPSGLAAGGSLLAGLYNADQLSTGATYANGTAKVNGTSSVPFSSTQDQNSVILNVGFNMIQVAIGITVGLFLSAIIVYPFGKRRSGLFSF